MTISQERFLKNFSNSFGAVFNVGLWLKNQGWEVSMPFPGLPEAQSHGDRPTLVERMRYQDDGDIEVRMAIEVKHRKLNFTCAQDFPFSTIFLNETYKADRVLNHRLLGFAIVNQAKTHAAFIPRTTRPYWIRDVRPDRIQARECETYCCPKQFAKFLRITP